MSDVTLKVKHVLESQILFLGGNIGMKNIDGFIHQPGLTEGLKKKAKRIAKKLTVELDDFQLTNGELLAEYGYAGMLPQELFEESLKNPEKFKEYETKVNDLLEEEILIAGVDKIDFFRIENLVFTSKTDFDLIYDNFFE